MKIIWIFLLKNESIYNFVWFWSTLLFFITEAEELPHLLIKHKRIVQLINEILGEDDHKTAERPTHTPLSKEGLVELGIESNSFWLWSTLH
jgi:hypothetical protein